MLFFHSKKTDEDNSALMAELARTKLALDTAYSNFENVVDPDLIDSCIYEVNAIQQRYRYLLRQLKMDETPAVLTK
ncbi:MAG: YaaL family protein [Lachnospiraceae bacterium]|nr:YaaL family protein [Lachnospiraceae bacterium]